MHCKSDISHRNLNAKFCNLGCTAGHLKRKRALQKKWKGRNEEDYQKEYHKLYTQKEKKPEKIKFTQFKMDFKFDDLLKELGYQ